ncbi:MAG: 50S ribosomal protein L20 [Saprospiraceae bacterium]|jgi:large subunit ribosomal protein L20|nr:50S ribosomal protein L20 [Saprospiraceae bacterium]
MARSVNHVASRARRKKLLKATKGFWGARRNILTAAKHTLERAWKYAYRDRKTKKRAFRALWIARINAAARMEGLSYSKLIHLLASKNITLNRKVLADLAMNHFDDFKAIVAKVK